MLTALMVLLRSIGLICGGHRAIVLENLALRQQLAVLTRTVKRPQLRSTDRLFWILLAKGWQDWRSALIVVQPDTVVRWHRQWLRRHWTRLSRRRRPGRPSASSAIRALVSAMTIANPLWGAPRIHGELAKLGITVSERTVSRLLRRPRRPPSQTWRTFLTNHVATLVSMDFFTVPTLTGRVLFVLVLLTHQRRRVIHVNVTEYPTAVWTAQQMIEAFPEDTAPRWLLRDRDAIYGDVFRCRVASSHNRRRHEQSLRAGGFTQAWIERNDCRRFRIECGRKVEGIEGAHGHCERQHQPLGTTMNRRRQFGMVGRRMQFRCFTIEALRFFTREALFAPAAPERGCHLR